MAEDFRLLSNDRVDDYAAIFSRAAELEGDRRRKERSFLSILESSRKEEASVNVSGECLAKVVKIRQTTYRSVWAMRVNQDVDPLSQHSSSQTVWAMADLPTPGAPLIHMIPFSDPSPSRQSQFFTVF